MTELSKQINLNNSYSKKTQADEAGLDTAPPQYSNKIDSGVFYGDQPTYNLTEKKIQ